MIVSVYPMTACRHASYYATIEGLSTKKMLTRLLLCWYLLVLFINHNFVTWRNFYYTLPLLWKRLYTETCISNKPFKSPFLLERRDWILSLYGWMLLISQPWNVTWDEHTLSHLIAYIYCDRARQCAGSQGTFSQHEMWLEMRTHYHLIAYIYWDRVRQRVWISRHIS